MPAWSAGATASAIFQQAMLNPLLGRAYGTAIPTGFTSLSADTINAALFNNTTVPDKTVTAALSAYAAATSQWIAANEVTSTNWAAGGRPLASKTCAIDTGTSSIVFNAANTAGGGNVTIANAYGCLVYDATISSPSGQGLCFNSFGGSAQGVTAGTFTIVWATVGATTAVFNITV